MFLFRSAPRLREVPQKIPNLVFLSGDFHVHPSLQGPFLFVSVHLFRRPPLPHSPPRRPSLPLRVPQSCSGGSSDPPARWPRAPGVIPRATGDLLFAVV